MQNMIDMRAIQKGFSISAVVVGGVGLVAGIWQVGSAELAALASLVGGATTLAIGIYGLQIRS